MQKLIAFLLAAVFAGVTINAMAMDDMKKDGKMEKKHDKKMSKKHSKMEKKEAMKKDEMKKDEMKK